MLRPVGTINHKYGTVVEVLHDSGARYNPMDFDWLVDLPEPATTTHAGATIPGQPDLVAIAEHYGTTLERKSKTELAGAHPQHGSSTGDNFNVNVAKGLWHCWRHGTGGDALALIAVCEGLVPCDAMQAGALRGEAFKRIVDIANSTFQAGITFPPRRAIPDMTQGPRPTPMIPTHNPASGRIDCPTIYGTIRTRGCGSIGSASTGKPIRANNSWSGTPMPSFSPRTLKEPPHDLCPQSDGHLH